METSVLSKKGKLILPKRLCKKYGFKPGVAIAFIEREQELLIKAMDAKYFDRIAYSIKDIVPTLEEFMAWKES
jgi:bifunctional DNA-binding transcriptional regulator/antitoxin component of YhaV-PrlF toxin-antitoxin module